MRDPADISLEEHLAAETEYTIRELAKEFNRPLCDVRFLENATEPEIYMAGGVWLPLSMVREMTGK